MPDPARHPPIRPRPRRAPDEAVTVVVLDLAGPLQVGADVSSLSISDGRVRVVLTGHGDPERVKETLRMLVEAARRLHARVDGRAAR